MGILDGRFAAYIAVAALLIITPGPDTALVTRNALRAGRRAASFTTLGIATGSVVWAFASVFGVAVLLEESTAVFTFWKFAGAAYLGYLGLRTLVATLRRGPQGSALNAAQPPMRMSGWASFRQGFVNNLLNPKAGAIFATAIPQFVLPGDTPLRLSLMLVAYEAILLSWLNLYGFLISRAGLSRFGTRVRTGLQSVTGVVLVALGIRLAFEHR